MRSLLFLLAGCPAVFDGQYDENVRDLDGDGAISDRFGGPDCRDQDPTITACDADGDGERSVAAGGTDCDDTDATVFPGAPERCNQVDDDCDGAIDNQDDDVQGEVRWWVDLDGDGAGDPAQGLVCQEFADPTNPATALHAGNDDDCDDTDPSIAPDADEICDGMDNDCDGVTDDAGIWLRDDDRDGYGVDGTQAVGPCTLGPEDAVASIGGDCDDSDPHIAPGRAEVPYDGVDSNCNGGLDDWDADFDGHVPSAWWAAAQAANALLPPDERWTLVQGDCDDDDPRAYVGAEEVCDGVDNDCDGAVDVDDLDNAGPTDELALRAQVSTWYLDLDGDGAHGTEVLLCPDDVQAGVHSPTSDDCYDSGSAPLGLAGADPATVREGIDETCDGFDNDCDGLVDHGLDPFPGSIPLFLDSDGDGVGATARHGCAADPALALVETGGDCNDAAANVFPGAPEICGDAIRQDCTTAHIFDCDGDGHQGSYAGGGDGTDCEDERPQVNPDVTFELCDGLDNDCDGLLDSADVDDLDAGPQPFWYPDGDGDGYGIDDGTGVQQCDQPPGRSIVLGDCDDHDPALSPETVWYADQDGDGFGGGVQYVQCVPPSGVPTVLQAGDCDDADAGLSPDTVWSLDEDGDGTGAMGTDATFCTPPSSEPWVLGSGVDCDDLDAQRSPGLPEIAGDGIDNDCDGVVDGGATTLWYVDADGDGFGDENDPGTSTWSPGLVPNDRDCDDSASGVNPAAQVELCDGIDNNCDGFSVLGDPDVSNPWQGVVLPDDSLPAYLASYDGTNYSLGLLVRTCTTSIPLFLQTPQAPIPLLPFDHIEDPTPFFTCPDGATTGTLYMRDADGDGVPGFEGPDDVALDCGAGHPAGFLELTGETDCAPRDPIGRVRVGHDEFGDVDGDLQFAGWTEQDACARAVQQVPGHDCDDADPNSLFADPFSEVRVPSGVLNDALAVCNHATLVLQGPQVLSTAALAEKDATDELVLRGEQEDTVVDVTVDSPHPIPLVLTLERLQLSTNDVAPVAGPLVVRDSSIFGLGFELVGEPALIERVRWDGPTVGTMIRIDVDTELVLRDALVLGGNNLADASQGRLVFEEVRLEHLTQGVSLDGTATLVVDDAELFDVGKPVALAAGTPSATLTDVLLTADGANPDPTFEITAGELVCDGCDVLHGASSGTIFSVSGGSLRLEESHVETLGHPSDTGVVRVTSGTATLHDTTVETGNGVALSNAGGQVVVQDGALKVTGLGVTAEASLSAVHTRFDGVSLHAPIGGTALQLWAGSAALSDVVLDSQGDGIVIDIAGVTVPITDLQVREVSGTAVTVANARVVLDSMAWQDPDSAGDTALVVAAGGDVVANDLSFDFPVQVGAEVNAGGRLAIHDSELRSLGHALYAVGGLSAPLATVSDSRLFSEGNSPAIELFQALVTVESSLVHAPASTLGAIRIVQGVAALDRVTVVGHASNSSVVVDDGELYAAHLLLQPDPMPAAALGCTGPSTVSITDSLFPLEPYGCGLSPGADRNFSSFEYDGSLDGSTFLAQDPFVRTWFGELALDQPVPSGGN